MTSPTISIASPFFHALPKSLIVIGRNHRINSYRHIGNGPCQQLFLYPFATMNWIRFEILGMGNQPSGMSKNTFTMWNFCWLMCRIIPCFPIEIPVGRHLFTTHLLPATAKHWTAMPKTHAVFHVRKSTRLPLTKMQLKPLHHSL